MTKFNARQFVKHGFDRCEQEDFNDDGTKFKVYYYGDTRVTYASACGEVYISAHIKFDYNALDYGEFYDACSAKHIDADCYNGVVSDSEYIDLEFLKEQIDAAKEVVEELVESGKDEEMSELLEERICYERKLIVDAMEAIKSIDWIEYDVTYPLPSLKSLKDAYKSLQNYCTKLDELGEQKTSFHKANVTVKKCGYVTVRDDNMYIKMAIAGAAA